MSNLEKELLLFELKEPNKEEFDQFKKEFLYSKQRMQIARTARKFIYDLEDCIVFLKRQLDSIQKFTPKEYKEFLKEIDAKRCEINKLSKHNEEKYNILLKENKRLIEKVAKLNLELSEIKENYSLYPKLKVNGKI